MENDESASPFTYSRYWLANPWPNVLTNLNTLIKEARQQFCVKRQKISWPPYVSMIQNDGKSGMFYVNT